MCFFNERLDYQVQPAGSIEFVLKSASVYFLCEMTGNEKNSTAHRKFKGNKNSCTFGISDITYESYVMIYLKLKIPKSLLADFRLRNLNLDGYFKILYLLSCLKNLILG